MRNLSATARRAIFSGETEEIFLPLLVIEDVGIAGNEPLRFVSNTESVWSRAHGEATVQEYLGWPFGLSLPDERDDQPTGMRLEIDNVDPRIMAAIRPLTAAPLLTIYIVLASSPDVVEAGPVSGRLAAVDYDAQKISATLRGPQVLVEPFPYRIFTPHEWPGVF